MTVATLPRKKDGTPATKAVGDAIDYWAERITNPTVAAAHRGERIQHRDGSVYADGDRLYHYGSDFEVARILRKGSTPTHAQLMGASQPVRSARLVLLNGDSYSGASGWGTSTGGVQASARQAVSRTNVPGITVPFSALAAAGIDFASIKPVELRDDRREIVERSSTKAPGKLVKMPCPTGATFVDNEVRHGYHVNGEPCRYDTEGAFYGAHTVPVTKPVLIDNPNECETPSEMHAWSREYAKLGDDGVWRWTIERHWLGDSLFKGKVTEVRSRKATDAELETLHASNAYELGYKGHQNTIARLTDERSHAQHGRYDWDRKARASVQVEPPKPELIPEIEVRLEAARAAYHAHCMQRPPQPVCNQHGRVVFEINRWAMFLSSFDYNEPHRPYFMCEMPYGCKAKTVEQAIRDLMPIKVESAIKRGVDVVRQGDVFAIATNLRTNELPSVCKPWNRDHTVFPLTGDPYKVCDVEFIHKFRRGDKGAMVLGTNHAATWVAYGENGETYMRGTLYHAPGAWRTPDHRAKKLGDGKTWYRAVKNTVPLDKASGSSRGSLSALSSTANRSGDSRAWTISGAVD